jgi:hypothetical protein
VYVKGNVAIREKDATSISYWNGCKITIYDNIRKQDEVYGNIC